MNFPSLQRMWVNQPSGSQPHHDLHGVRVLAQLEDSRTFLVYFLSGPIVSQQMTPLALSPGWPAATFADPQPSRDRARKTLEDFVGEMARHYPEAGLRLGYIGNLERDRDDRSWRIFTRIPQKSAQKTPAYLSWGEAETADLGRLLQQAKMELEPWLRSTMGLPERSLDEKLAYLSHLPQACNHLDAGCYFESGGCWGMALALREDLEQQGIASRILVSDRDFIHAQVEVNGLLYDYRGECDPENADSLIEAPDEASLLAIAARFGYSAEDVFADKAWALDVIEQARLFHSQSQEAPSDVASATNPPSPAAFSDVPF